MKTNYYFNNDNYNKYIYSYEENYELHNYNVYPIPYHNEFNNLLDEGWIYFYFKLKQFETNINIKGYLLK